MELKIKYSRQISYIIKTVLDYSNLLVEKLNIKYLNKNTNKWINYFYTVQLRWNHLDNLNILIIDEVLGCINHLIKKYLIEYNDKIKKEIYLRKFLIFIVKSKIFLYFLLNSLDNKINDMVYLQKENNYFNITVKEYSKYNINEKYKDLKKLMMINIITIYYMFNKNFKNFKNLYDIEFQRPNNFLKNYDYNSLKNIKIVKVNLLNYSLKILRKILMFKSYKEIKEEFDFINCFACPWTYFSFTEIPNYMVIKRTLSLAAVFFNKQKKYYINVNNINNKFFKKNESELIDNNIIFLKNNNHNFTEDEFNEFTESKKKINSEMRKMRIISNISKSYDSTTPINVIYHIHGGGFICLSSSQYKFFFKYLINKIKNCVIFAMDYQLSPKETYPYNFNDVIIGYIWSLNYIRLKLNLNNYNINIMGDSAGGNLSGMLMNWIIENNLKVPKTLVMSYPVISFNTTSYSESHKYLFKDVLLNYGFLSICLNSYIPQNVDFENDYYLNLFKTPLNIIKKYPKTMINVCDKDVLKDNAIRYYYFLKNKNIDVNCILYKDTFHGIINFAFYYKLKCLMEVNKDISSFINANN